MWECILKITLVVGTILTLYCFAKKMGKREEKLKRLQEEIEERKRMNEILDSIRNMSDDDIRARLQDISDIKH